MKKAIKGFPPRTAEPRLPRALAPLVDPTIDDETEWTGIELKGDIALPEEVSYLEISSSRLVQVRFTGCRFNRLRLIDVLLEDCDLSAATLEDTSLVRVEFRRCRMSWLEGAGLRAQDVCLRDVKLDGANLRMTQWERCSLEDCDLSDADFYSAQLPDARFLGCNLVGAQFSKADLRGSVLHGSTLEGVRAGDSLRGVIIGSDQVLPLSTSVFAALGILIDDDHPASKRERSD